MEWLRFEGDTCIAIKQSKGSQHFSLRVGQQTQELIISYIFYLLSIVCLFIPCCIFDAKSSLIEKN